MNSGETFLLEKWISSLQVFSKANKIIFHQESLFKANQGGWLNKWKNKIKIIFIEKVIIFELPWSHVFLEHKFGHGSFLDLM